MDLRDLAGHKFEACVVGKMTRRSFKRRSVAKRVRDGVSMTLWHTDICGPITPVSLGGSRYFATFTDDGTNMLFVAFLKTKDEVLPTFEQLEA